MNIIQDVIDLEVFNEEGKLVTKISTVREVDLRWISDGEDSYLSVTDGLVNFKLIEQLGEVEENNLSDFEKRVSNVKSSKTVVFNKNSNKKAFKLIGRGITYSAETAEVSHDFEIIIPKVELVNEYHFNSESGEVHNPRFVFKINPYNSNNDLFKVVLHERDKK